MNFEVIFKISQGHSMDNTWQSVRCSLSLPRALSDILDLYMRCVTTVDLKQSFPLNTVVELVTHRWLSNVVFNFICDICCIFATCWGIVGLGWVSRSWSNLHLLSGVSPFNRSGLLL